MYQNILVAIDLDDASDLKRTLSTAVELNRLTGAACM